MSKIRDAFLSQLDLLGFEREVRFIDGRKFAFDAALPDVKVAVEYSGIMGLGASHASVSGLVRDAWKLNEAQLRGWTVITANAKSVEDGSAMDQVIRALESRGREIA